MLYIVTFSQYTPKYDFIILQHDVKQNDTLLYIPKSYPCTLIDT